MIKCFVNAHGYYIHGDNVEIGNSITPLTVQGELVLDPLQHLYAVMYLALVELKGLGKDRVFIYNDSRIIDDMNGKEPLDVWYQTARTMMRQRIIPDICGVVFFRKQASRDIDDKIRTGLNSLGVNDPNRDRKLLERFERAMKRQEAVAKTRAGNLRRRWFDAKGQ